MEDCQKCACVGCSEGNCCDHTQGQWYDDEDEKRALDKFLQPIKEDPLKAWAKEVKKWIK
jgi:hypothetical protein